MLCPAAAAYQRYIRIRVKELKDQGVQPPPEKNLMMMAGALVLYGPPQLLALR